MRAKTTQRLFVLASLLAMLSGGGGSIEGGAATEPAAANRLAGETSPYLLLHAYNPVDWYPWGPEALEKARREGKPIFLSIGYSTCFWCHVMEREVFTDPEIAALMNRWFVNIKVDREERPDLDEIYMTATQMLTGSGGWPNSVFLTPSLQPFFAGTYFPPTDGRGRPGFPTVLTRIHEAWTTRRAEVEASGVQIMEAMSKVLTGARAPAEEVPGVDAAGRAVEALKGRYDPQYGGFSKAPKFPSPANMYLLAEASRGGDEEAAAMLRKTLEKMSRGGIFDQLGGGFHRYSTDRIWLTPHFEKMLYDNAQLAELLIEFGRERELPELVRAGRATLDFVLGDLALPGGAFKSAIDAETDGEEGAYYTWTREELEEILGEEFALLAPVYGLDGAPNFEQERYILFLGRSWEDSAADLGIGVGEFAVRIEEPRRRLLERRRQREHPLIDDKVLTDWTGMTIAALARAGDLLSEPRYVAAATRAADFLLQNLRDGNGKLLHTWRQGNAKLPAYLDDYAFFVRGLLALEAATGEVRWLTAAARLADEMEERLRIPAGGYYLNARSDDVIFQPRSVLDSAIPAANGVVILDLMELGRRTGRPAFRERAEAALRAFSTDLQQYPQAAQTLALAVWSWHETAALVDSGPLEIASSDAMVATGSGGPQKVITVRGVLSAATGGPSWREFSLAVDIDPGWHLNAHPASSEFVIPTTVEGEVRSLRYPSGEPMSFAFTDEQLSVYTGHVEIGGEVGGGAGRISFTYQACDDRRCLSPRTVQVELTADEPLEVEP